MCLSWLLPATKGYKCLDPSTSRVYISRHVKFVETEFPYPTLIPTSVSSSTSPITSSFHVPLTDFSDIIVSIPVSSNVNSLSVPVFGSSSTPSYTTPVTLPVLVPVTSVSEQVTVPLLHLY